MTDEDKIAELKIEAAILNEKVKRLEWIIYGVAGFIFMQLIGLFVLWAKDVMAR